MGKMWSFIWPTQTPALTPIRCTLKREMLPKVAWQERLLGRAFFLSWQHQTTKAQSRRVPCLWRSIIRDEGVSGSPLRSLTDGWMAGSSVLHALTSTPPHTHPHAPPGQSPSLPCTSQGPSTDTRHSTSGIRARRHQRRQRGLFPQPWPQHVGAAAGSVRTLLRAACTACSTHGLPRCYLVRAFTTGLPALHAIHLCTC